MRVENRGRPKDSVKREAILSAARELFMANGFVGTSMDNLAAAAGVSKATLYSHFSDKDALYSAIIEGKVKDYRLQDFSARLSGDMACDLVLIACDIQDLVFDDDASAKEAHEVATKIEEALRDELGETTMVTTHLEPERDHERIHDEPAPKRGGVQSG